MMQVEATGGVVDSYEPTRSERPFTCADLLHISILTA